MRDEDPEKKRARAAAWYAANREKVKAAANARYAANPEKMKAYQAAHRAANPEKMKARGAAWLAANREKMKAYCDARRAVRVAQLHPAYVAGRLGLPVAEVTPELLEMKREQLTLHRLGRQVKAALKGTTK